LLSNFLVVPRGGCTQVIETVKALKRNPQFHHLEIYGVIDRDRRIAEEIDALEKHSIFVLDVAEVKNLFCTKEVLEIVSKRLARDHRVDFYNFSSSVIDELSRELENQVSLHASSEIKFLLNTFDDRSKGLHRINSKLLGLCNMIDVYKIYTDTEEKFKSALLLREYNEILRLYNRKKLPIRFCNTLGLNNGELPELVIRLVRTEERANIINAVKKYFRNFQNNLG